MDNADDNDGAPVNFTSKDMHTNTLLYVGYAFVHVVQGKNLAPHMQKDKILTQFTHKL